MKFYKKSLLLFLCLGILFLAGCSDSDSNHINSSQKLLPSKITVEYTTSNKHILSYEYDNENRLVKYIETSLFGNSISMEDMETICKITYNEQNDIDSLIIMPRLLEDVEDFNSSISLLARDTILFDYDGQNIRVLYKNKKEELITVNPRKEVLSYQYYSGSGSGMKIVNSYEYDDRGNILKIIMDNGVGQTYIPYTYAYDNRNGVFKHVNIPQWFMVIMLNQSFNLSNNNERYLDYNGTERILHYEYNMVDYPVFRKVKLEEINNMKVSEMPTTFEYIYAK